MILGIGVDLLSLSRFRGLINRRGVDRLARRILSNEERKEWGTRLAGGEEGSWSEQRTEMFLATR